MPLLTSTFQQTNDVLERTTAEGLQTGGQLYIEHRSEILADIGFGSELDGAPINLDIAMNWFSAGKPLTAVAVGQLVEAGACDWHDRVAGHLPEFGANGKEAVTLHHILTHTAGFRSADRLAPQETWQESLEQIYAAPLEPDWPLGEKAGYHTGSSWFVLAALVERLSGLPFETFMRERIFGPATMNRSSFTPLPNVAFVRVRSKQGPGGPNAMPDNLIPRPGSSARGPIRELGLFYRNLLAGELVKQATLNEMTKRQRVGMHDHTFLHKLDFGYGFVIDSNQYGAQTVPYGYGLHSSPETFGHSGVQCSCAFADPANELIVAWVMNLQPGERLHQRRARDLNSAIYVDLRLA